MDTERKSKCRDESHVRNYTKSYGGRPPTWRCYTCNKDTKEKRKYPNGKPIPAVKLPKVDRLRDWYLRRTFGISLREYAEMLFEQDCVCAICGNHEPGGTGYSFYVDHDHKTGKVRALLCFSCNVSIGHFKEDTALMHDAIRYLDDHASQ